MVHLRSDLRLAAGAFAIAAALGCSAPAAPGWQRLWADDWRLVGSGVQWVSGVPAAGRVIEVTDRGLELRTELLNPGAAAAEVRLAGAGRFEEWVLAGGESRPVTVRLAPGEWRLDAPSEVVLGSPRLGRPLVDPQLLVVVVVDTLRADHVTAALMPGVTAFFADGRRWSDAVANAPWTLPSVASMFAGRPVLELTSPEGELIGLPDGVPSWATVLHRAGFEGGAVVANPTVHALNGFAAGFSSFAVPEGGAVIEAPDGGWVVDAARRWLAAHDGEHGFLYLHLMDPHEPYRDHTGDGEAGPPLRPLARRQRRPTADEASLLRTLYRGEVRHTDRVLTPLLTGLPPDAAVVFTSDHGEALGEHGSWAHGLNLYREALDVPLMIRAPGAAPGAAPGPVELLDVAPTLLELAGVEADPGMSGRSLLGGGPAPPVISTTFSGGPLRWAWRDGDRKVVLRMAAQPGLGAVERRGYVAARPLPSGAFFFDLASDPAEQRPLPVPDELTDEIAAAFAGSAGRMVPGLQLLVRAVAGTAAATVEIGDAAGIVQAWSPDRIEIDRREGRLEIRCAEADPVCTVALSADTIADRVTPLDSSAGWCGLTAGEPVRPAGLGFPESIGSGAHLWWNPERPLVVGGHDETVERLRALGYIE